VIFLSISVGFRSFCAHFVSHIEIRLRHRCFFMCCTSIGKRSFLLPFPAFILWEVLETEGAIDAGFLPLLLVFWVIVAQGVCLSLCLSFQCLQVFQVEIIQTGQWFAPEACFPDLIIEKTHWNCREIHSGSSGLRS